ncbi:hypothetical protein [Rhodopseudomonas sp. AAP120]|uniref:hypothetical protein n=1 Tax=Rhodopseudomonas sp. AAP120 TaxID=1523430 RepID=UPI0012E18FE3|nr:hypothetical protein [Rhodopseudomonas sp. AAP120]
MHKNVQALILILQAWSSTHRNNNAPPAFRLAGRFCVRKQDAIDNLFDRAISISADSDHVPAVRRVRFRLPAKQIFAGTPSGRRGHARELLNVCNPGQTLPQVGLLGI